MAHMRNLYFDFLYRSIVFLLWSSRRVCVRIGKRLLRVVHLGYIDLLPNLFDSSNGLSMMTLPWEEMRVIFSKTIIEKIIDIFIIYYELSLL